MTENGPTDSAATDGETQQPGVVRKNRGIRFSESEWDEVKSAAQSLDITPAEFVRDTILAVIRSPKKHDRASIPADLAPLIERTFRYTYMLATKMRDDMIEHGQNETLESLIEEARKLQDDLRRAVPE